jgi:hypothetical protein
VDNWKDPLLDGERSHKPKNPNPPADQSSRRPEGAPCWEDNPAPESRRAARTLELTPHWTLNGAVGPFDHTCRNSGSSRARLAWFGNGRTPRH